MHIEQRHVTTVNLHDGKARDFVVFRDGRGCKVSALARDEVLNVFLSCQDFQRLGQTLVRPNGHDVKDVPADAPAADGGASPSVSETTTPGWTTIRVDQRQVTTVALHPSRAREFVLSRDDRGYKLSCVAKDEVVTLLLAPGDFHKLRQQVAKWEGRPSAEARRDGADGREEAAHVRRDVPEAHEARRPHQPISETCEVAGPGRAEVVPYPWGGIDWLGFN